MGDDWRTYALIGGVLGLLGGATMAGQVLKRHPDTGLNAAAIRTFNLRVRAWWLMASVLAATFVIGQTATVIMFGLISFWALREFITLTPTRLGDHRALFWIFFVGTPLQFVLVGMSRPGARDYYDLYSVMIPVYFFLFIPIRIAWSGDYKRFLERAAKIQAGVIICVYCLSYAPALLSLNLKVNGNTVSNYRLLFFFVLMVQLGDALQYLWGRLMGRRIIAPAISPNKTWEGLLGAMGSAALIGAALSWATPFEAWQAAGLSLLITAMGFAGGMVMSAIKRDRGVKDYGTLVEGHSGVLDRIDSICFAAPVFFHVTRACFHVAATLN